MILVIEDEPDILNLIRWTLEDEGLAVATAPDARTGLARCARERPDLVILDLMLPDLGGDSVAERLRERWGAELPILLVSADVRRLGRVAAAVGAAHLPKPFDLDRLLDAVRGATGAA